MEQCLLEPVSLVSTSVMPRVCVERGRFATGKGQLLWEKKRGGIDQCTAEAKYSRAVGGGGTSTLAQLSTARTIERSFKDAARMLQGWQCGQIASTDTAFSCGFVHHPPPHRLAGHVSPQHNLSYTATAYVPLFHYGNITGPST